MNLEKNRAEVPQLLFRFGVGEMNIGIHTRFEKSRYVIEADGRLD